jgi:hypothetical protein
MKTSLVFVGQNMTVAVVTLLLMMMMSLVMRAEAIIPRIQMKDLSEIITSISKHQPSYNQNPTNTLDESNQNWMSLNPSMEYLPIMTNINHHHHPQHHHQHHRILENHYDYDDQSSSLFRQFSYQDLKETKPPTVDPDTDPYRLQPFTSGVNNYDEYQQAWRMLGFIVDCDVHDGDDDQQQQQQQQHSRDDNNGMSSADGCVRFLLWAAVSLPSPNQKRTTNHSFESVVMVVVIVFH